MTKTQQIKPEFVQFMPATLSDGVLYISSEFGTAIHQCCCGCGSRVVTPLSATDWTLTVNGADVSLYPSIGNWSFLCRSHYWIRGGRVLWAEDWSQDSIDMNRSIDQRNRDEYFKNQRPDVPLSRFRRFVHSLKHLFRL